ncbi:MAG: hypothetical protein ACO3N7_05595 [Kiritimatiellia bacterium]
MIKNLILSVFVMVSMALFSACSKPAEEPATMEEAAESAETAAGQAMEATEAAAGEAMDNAEEVVEDAAGAVEEMADDAKSAAEDM